MRELSAEARLHFYARSLTQRTGRSIHSVALYGAFVLIAAVVLAVLTANVPEKFNESKLTAASVYNVFFYKQKVDEVDLTAFD